MRQLKQFLRKRKAEMLACGDCECRTLKCWREATCDCVKEPEPTPPTPTTYTVTITVNDDTMWSVDVTSLIVEEWTTIIANNNILTIDTTNITAAAATGYEFSAWVDDNWDPLPASVSWDITIVATFEVEQP